MKKILFVLLIVGISYSTFAFNEENDVVTVKGTLIKVWGSKDKSDGVVGTYFGSPHDGDKFLNGKSCPIVRDIGGKKQTKQDFSFFVLPDDETPIEIHLYRGKQTSKTLAISLANVCAKLKNNPHYLDCVNVESLTTKPEVFYFGDKFSRYSVELSLPSGNDFGFLF